MNLFRATADGRFSLSVPLTKYDERTGEFEGWMAVDELDHSKEIIDLDGSLPYFQKWQEKYATATNGASYGNVREQHDPKKAAGKLTAYLVEGTTPKGKRGWKVSGAAVDPVAKEKLAAGVLCALSIGGDYVEKTAADDIAKGAVRYIADPVEVSLVDAPCMPSAMITVVKADGSEELRKAVGFQPSQFWSCRAGLDHGHVTKAEAKVCDGSTPVKKSSGDVIVEKCLSCVSQLVAAVGLAQFVDGFHEGDDPAFEATDGATDAAVQQLYDALIEYVAALKEEFTGEESAEGSQGATVSTNAGDYSMATPDGDVIHGDPVFMLSAIVDGVNKGKFKVPESFNKSLRVQLGNGSSNTHKEDIVSEQKKEEKAAPVEKQEEQKPAEKADDNALAKATDALNKVTAAISKLAEKQNEIDAKMADFEKAVATLDETIRIALETPAAPKATVRAVKKAEDGETDKPAVKKTGNPLVDEARLVGTFGA